MTMRMAEVGGTAPPSRSRTPHSTSSAFSKNGFPSSVTLVLYLVRCICSTCLRYQMQSDSIFHFHSNAAKWFHVLFIVVSASMLLFPRH
jgi:hypothetical protein